ncbi:cupredoxin domain-containing protein [Variovorax ginsengisoli]|uniref:Cupredoxin family protein n=1 Tax=Variovorax ginsengisoli TaxID=363844 RepID=A0ABT8S5C4_9BURK|nr:cupredoxin family protein [Variovorax ginsengisoli]MDN8614947.1 cupredoxin family protein [Variovorax ginsengisoli]MDO1534117.1 cupredoxin family protein [Variovorax ginsengisoli]
MKTRLALHLAASTLLFATAAAFAHGNEDHAAAARKYDSAKVEAKAFGQEGDPAKVTRVVKLSMADTMRFTPADVVVKRGETVKFLVHNDGKVLHEMVLGTPRELKAHAELMRKFPEMEHSEANMAHVKPSTDGEIIWQFTKAGEFQFACLIPGHFEAGMVGKVTVK